MTVTSPFSAADSALGYLYQVRIALLWSLRRLKYGSDFAVSLETLDDVVFETSGGLPQELLQTKHHRDREATLADASPDLWKSLRIWFEGLASGTIPTDTALHLLTTGKAVPGSVASHLRAEGRDVAAALGGLEATARSSSSVSNASAYAAFLDTASADREALLHKVVVLDGAPHVTDLRGDLTAELFWAVERKNQDSFLRRLEGWWLQRSLRQLWSMDVQDRILAAEIEAQISDLREQFKQDSLPIDDDLLNFTLDEATRAAHADSVFVHQIELTKAGRTRILAAIRDYYRAFEQRSRWMREELLLVGELSSYERRLIEEWELVFAEMEDRCGRGAADETKECLAREILQWTEQVAPTRLSIRPHVTEPFLARGSLHMLADDIRVGWHPDFRIRLAALIGAKGTVA